MAETALFTPVPSILFMPHRIHFCGCEKPALTALQGQLLCTDHTSGLDGCASSCSCVLAWAPPRARAFSRGEGVDGHVAERHQGMLLLVSCFVAERYAFLCLFG